MNRYALSHINDQVLLRDLASHVARNCAATADLLAHLAEVDSRKLYLPAAHPSMHSYCVHVLHLSEQAAYKRIRVARIARELPAIYTAIASGRVSLGGMTLLAPHLDRNTLEELMAASEHRTCEEIAQLLAQRFPKPDLPTHVSALAPGNEESGSQLSTWRAATGNAGQPSSDAIDSTRAKITPRAPERFALHFTVRKEAHDKLRYVQSLLSHQAPAGDLPQVFERALDALIVSLEKTKFAATNRPRTGKQHVSTNPRHIPAHVKRAVRERDDDRCTFVSESGARCPAVKLLEFDHILEVARGGEATIDGMRLRCRAHNQFEAERTFGSGFMERKRDEARRAALERRATTVRRIPEPAPADACSVVTEIADANDVPVAVMNLAPGSRSAAEGAAAAQQEVDLDLLHCLKGLGVRSDQARLAMEHSRGNPEASIEERLHAAIKFLGLRGRTYALRQAVLNRSGSGASSPPASSSPASSSQVSPAWALR